MRVKFKVDEIKQCLDDGGPAAYETNAGGLAGRIQGYEGWDTRVIYTVVAVKVYTDANDPNPKAKIEFILTDPDEAAKYPLGSTFYADLSPVVPAN